MLHPACRPHTLNSTSTSKSFQSTVTGELNAPYSKQFVHSKSSQYRRMKTEWKSNVYLARSRIQVGKTFQERRKGGIWHSGEKRPVCENSCTWLWEQGHVFYVTADHWVYNTSKPTRSRWACTFCFPSGQTVLYSTLCSREQVALASAYTRVFHTLVNNPVKIVPKCAPVLEITLRGVAQVKPSGAQHVTSFASCRPYSQRPLSTSPWVSKAGITKFSDLSGSATLTLPPSPCLHLCRPTCLQFSQPAPLRSHRGPFKQSLLCRSLSVL